MTGRESALFSCGAALKHVAKFKCAYVPLPPDREPIWFYTMEEIIKCALEVDDGLEDSSCDNCDDFDFGC